MSWTMDSWRLGLQAQVRSQDFESQLLVFATPSPPSKSLGFGGFDSSKLLILRVGILMSV